MQLLLTHGIKVKTSFASSMEDNKNPPILPSNYVTLSELQERWKKEQQRKLKEKKEKEEQHQMEKQQNQQLERNTEPYQVKLKERTDNRRRDKNREFSRRNREFKKNVSGVSPGENCLVAVDLVEENEGERNASESNGKDLRDNEVNKKWRNKKNKKRQKEKRKIVKDEEERTEGEGEIVVPETGAPPVKSEENIPAKRYGRRRDARSVHGRKSTSIVEKVDSRVDMEEETKNVVEESKENVEIEQKLGDICIRKEDDGSETQNSTVNNSNSEYRDYNRIVNRTNSEYRGRYRNVYRGNTNYGGYEGGFNRRNLNYRGGYSGRGIRSMERNRMVWVKKECVAEATEEPEIEGREAR